jgi:(1->4)-alpha-D-glucan 1-alpha-D-glucosylmutase
MELLRLRRENPGLFTAGDYVPLNAEGPRAAHVFAFARRHEGRTAIAVIPRLIAKLDGPDFWGDTRLPIPSDLATGPAPSDAFTARTPDLSRSTLPLSELFRDFPVAVLLT